MSPYPEAAGTASRVNSSAASATVEYVPEAANRVSPVITWSAFAASSVTAPPPQSLSAVT